MAFSVENLVPANQDGEGQRKPSGNWSVENLVPVDTDKSSPTPFDSFRQSSNQQVDQNPTQDEKTTEVANKTPLNAKEGHSDRVPADQNLDYPHEDFLNAGLHIAEGSVWKSLAAPFQKNPSPDMDQYLSQLEKKHPIAQVVAGTAPFIATSAFVPESLVPNIYARTAAQFGIIGLTQSVGKAKFEDKPLLDKAKDVGIETAKQTAFAPIYAKAQALQILDRPFATALSRAGIITAGSGVMSTFFGDNITEAFKQGGIYGAASLIMESPHLAHTVIGQGILKHMNSLSADMRVKTGIPDIDPKGDNVAQETHDVAELMASHIKGIDKPQIVAATVKMSDGTESHGASHEDALEKIGHNTKTSYEDIKSPENKNLKPITLEDFNQEKSPLKLEDIKVESKLLDKVNELQNLLGKQIKISSGFRTPEYNKELKARGYNVAENSLHLSGRAADIPVTKDLTHDEIVNAAHKVGLDVEDLKLTPKHVHVELPTENTPTFGLEKKRQSYTAGFTVQEPDGTTHFITRAESKEPPFNLPNGNSEDVPGLNESKFIPHDPVRIVNPETLENQSGEYVHNKPLEISFGKNDRSTAKSLRLEFSGIKNEQIVRGNQLADKIKRLVPDLEERQALFWYKAAEGNTDFMLEMLSEDAMKSYEKQIKRAFDLSPNALKALDMMNKYYKESGDVATEIGTIRDVKENYQNRIYKPEPPKDFVSNEIKKGLKQTTSHAKRRVYDNEFDAVMGGKQFATTDVADALSIHNEEMARVNTARKLADAMVEGKLGAWKKPDNIPEGWEQVGTISKSVPLKDDTGQAIIGEDGNQVVAKSVFVAPKGIVKGLAAIVEPNYISRIDSLRGLQKYQGIVKTVDLSLSFFHHFTMGMQVLYQGGIRTFMSLPNMTRMIETDSFAELEKDFVKHGGITSKVESNQDVLRSLVEHDGSLGSKIENLPVIKQYLGTTEKMANFLFGKIQRYLKVMDHHEKAAEWASKNPDASNEEVKTAMQGIAKQVNAAYGGLNWEAMGVTKSNLSLLRLGLLAPDWTISNAALLKYALGEGKTTAGNLSRTHIISALAVGMVLTEGINQMLTGHTTDKNPKGHALEVEIAPNVYVSFLRGGIGDISKFASMVTESGLGGVSRFAQGKLSPFARTLIGLLNNVQYTGRAIVKKGEGPVVGTYHVMSYLLANAGPVPFGIGTTALQYSTDPNKTLTGGLAVGLGIARYSKSKQQEDKEITPYKQKQLDKESKMDPLHKKTAHMSFEKVTDLLKNADDKDRPELERILEKKRASKKKIHNWTKHDEDLYQQSFGQ